MRRLVFALASVVAATTGGPALAFPPTAIPSPGYDRALAESRKARQMPPVILQQDAVRPKKKRRR